jgi:hypothetical protein
MPGAAKRSARPPPHTHYRSDQGAWVHTDWAGHGDIRLSQYMPGVPAADMWHNTRSLAERAAHTTRCGCAMCMHTRSTPAQVPTALASTHPATQLLGKLVDATLQRRVTMVWRAPTAGDRHMGTPSAQPQFMSRNSKQQ